MASTAETNEHAADVALAVRCLRGDQGAMCRLVERHQAAVLRLCMRMLGNRHDAEDVVQETFVRALRSLERWDAARRFEPWLLAIAANRCRTALGKRHTASYDQQMLAEELPARRDSHLALNQLAEEVQLALGELRGEYRQAFVLFHHEELAYAEIAEVMDIPIGTVKTWIHRARQEIAATLLRRGVVETVETNEEHHALPSNRMAAARVAG